MNSERYRLTFNLYCKYTLYLLSAPSFKGSRHGNLLLEVTVTMLYRELHYQFTETMTLEVSMTD